jgi:microcystin-dependent protein
MATADNLSPLLNLLLMGDGQHFNTWGDLTNANLNIIDTAIAGNSTVNVGSGNVTMTPAQTAAAILTFTGALTSATIVTLPPVPGRWVISNQTTGFALSLRAGPTGAQVVIPSASIQNHVYYTDGVNIFDASASTAAISAAIVAALAVLVPPGLIVEFAMQTAPSGWLECNGNAMSRTVFAPLFAAIGTTWGNGDGATTFNLPDFRGVFRRGWDDSKGIDVGRVFASSQSDSFASHTHLQNPHTHMITDPGHVHGIGPSGVPLNVSIGGVPANQPGGGVTNSAVTGITVNNATAINQAIGGTETVPKNYAVLPCIKT